MIVTLLRTGSASVVLLLLFAVAEGRAQCPNDAVVKEVRIELPRGYEERKPPDIVVGGQSNLTIRHPARTSYVVGLGRPIPASAGKQLQLQFHEAGWRNVGGVDVRLDTLNDACIVQTRVNLVEIYAVDVSARNASHAELRLPMQRISSAKQCASGRSPKRAVIASGPIDTTHFTTYDQTVDSSFVWCVNWASAYAFPIAVGPETCEVTFNRDSIAAFVEDARPAISFRNVLDALIFSIPRDSLPDALRVQRKECR